jgi:hypothetical protein
MLYQNMLQAAWITELEEQLAVITKRNTHKQKQIQQGSTMEYSEAVAQVAAEASVATKWLKKACGSSNQRRVQPALQYYGNCGGTEHNMLTCRKDTDASSESDASTVYASSWFNSDIIEEL